MVNIHKSAARVFIENVLTKKKYVWGGGTSEDVDDLEERRGSLNYGNRLQNVLCRLDRGGV